MGPLPAHAAVRRRRGAARDQRVLGARRAAVAADAPARRPRPLRRGHPRPRLPRHEPARARPRQHGAPPWRRQPRHVPRRPVGARHEVDRSARQRGAEGALAARHGPPGCDRRLRAHRARPRLRLGRARDDRSPQWRRAGAGRRQALARQRLHRRRRRRLGPLGRGRSGQGLPGRDRHAGVRGRDDDGEGRRARDLAGGDKAPRRARPRRRPDAGGKHVRGRGTRDACS